VAGENVINITPTIRDTRADVGLFLGALTRGLRIKAAAKIPPLFGHGKFN
jgi:hypothetical protein